LPVLSGAHGLPIGVQLVGKYADDEHLIETSKWFLDILG
jgi:Asp-tRNA(Asn)/Glu-tRNA(Gln) amidotransferase A subunit family amidase